MRYYFFIRTCKAQILSLQAKLQLYIDDKENGTLNNIF